MEINYSVAGVVILIVVALVIFIILKNRRDARLLEKTLNESEIQPEEHDEGAA